MSDELRNVSFNVWTSEDLNTHHPWIHHTVGRSPPTPVGQSNLNRNQTDVAYCCHKCTETERESGTLPSTGWLFRDRTAGRNGNFTEKQTNQTHKKSKAAVPVWWMGSTNEWNVYHPLRCSLLFFFVTVPLKGFRTGCIFVGICSMFGFGREQGKDSS